MTSFLPWGVLAACGVFCAALQRFAMRTGTNGQSCPPLGGDCAAILVGAQLGALFFLVTGRPWMSLVLCLSLLVGLLVVNRVKERVLREPLVLADAWLLPQVWKYPEMYIPFLPAGHMVMGALGIAATLACLAWFEPRIAATGAAAVHVVALCLVLGPVALVIAMRRGRLPSLARSVLRMFPVSHQAALDAARHGPLACALVHPVAAGVMEHDPPEFMMRFDQRPTASVWPDQFDRFVSGLSQLDVCERPHVVVVQAESFSDTVEESRTGRPPTVSFPRWRALREAGRVLPTPDGAFGAYTMRTEFSLLTGLPARDLGPFAFNPYILAARRPLWSLARHFNGLGYRTVCCHPYHKGFFQRDKVMAHLGFSHFADIAELGHLERCGPYIGDVPLMREARDRFLSGSDPVFLFMITMENHGPWTGLRLPPETLLGGSDLDPELRTYLTHAANCDASLAEMQPPRLKGVARPVDLWVYSDHDPVFTSHQP